MVKLDSSQLTITITKTMANSDKEGSALTRVNSTQETAEKFLRFQLGEEGIALLPLSIIKQVMQVSPSEILSVPQMPNSVMGIYNWRGEMLWLVDIGQVLGFPPVRATSPQQSAGGLMTIAIEVEDKVLGLVVQQINDIERHKLQEMNLPAIGLFSPEVLPYLQGYLIGGQQEVLMVLNGAAIFQAPLWQMHKLERR
jgi:positive phototaxis protein PixI